MGIQQASVGMAAVIASILIPAAQVFAPVVQEYLTTDMKLDTEKEVTRARLALEESLATEKQREQVADILLNRYIDQDSTDQRAAVAIIVGLFPRFAKDLEDAFARYASTERIKNEVEEQVAVLKNIERNDLEIARTEERAGFEALLIGDPITAKTHFNAAYAAYPTYHNVDEIRRKLDTLNVEDPTAVERTLQSIRMENAWRMPEHVRQQLLQQTSRQ